MAASGNGRPQPALEAAPVQCKVILVGEGHEIQTACVELDWDIFYVPERQTQLQNQGRVQSLMRARKAELLLISVPKVRGGSSALASFANRISGFCEHAKQCGVPIIIFSHTTKLNTWTHATIRRV